MVCTTTSSFALPIGSSSWGIHVFRMKLLFLNNDSRFKLKAEAATAPDESRISCTYHIHTTTMSTGDEDSALSMLVAEVCRAPFRLHALGNLLHTEEAGPHARSRHDGSCSRLESTCTNWYGTSTFRNFVRKKNKRGGYQVVPVIGDQ